MSPSPAPELTPHGGPRDLLRGLGLPLRAFGLILRTPRLLGLSLLAALVTSVTLAGLGYFLWGSTQHLGAWLVGEGNAWQRAGGTGLGVLLFLLGFVVGALTLPNLVLAPLQDPLSEATEARVGDFTAPPFSLRAMLRGTLESLRHTLLRLVLMTLGFVLLWPLNLIPGAGSVLWATLSATWSMFWLAVEHLSNPMARNLYPFGLVVRTLRARKSLAFGFGAALWVLLWVPVLNFFLMPVAVVAGTLLYRGLRGAGALPPPEHGNAAPARGVGLP